MNLSDEQINKHMWFYSRFYVIINPSHVWYFPKTDFTLANVGTQITLRSASEGTRVGCPTSYSCHVDSVLLYSKFEAKRIKYWNSKFKYLQIRYSSIPRRTWLFQIFLRDIRDIRETDFHDDDHFSPQIALYPCCLIQKEFR